jgi:hypothetical protein
MIGVFRLVAPLLLSSVLLGITFSSCKPKKQASAQVASAPESRMAFVTWTLDLKFDIGKETERSLQCLYYFENTLQWFLNNPASDKLGLLSSIVSQQPGGVRFVNIRALDPDLLALEMERLGALSEAAVVGRPEPRGQSLLGEKGTVADRLLILAAHRLDTAGAASPYPCPNPQALSAVLEVSSDPNSPAAEDFKTRIALTNELTAEGQLVKESGLTLDSGGSNATSLNLNPVGAAANLFCLKMKVCDDFLKGAFGQSVAQVWTRGASKVRQVASLLRGKGTKPSVATTNAASNTVANTVTRETAEAASTQVAKKVGALTDFDKSIVSTLEKGHMVRVTRDQHARILVQVRKDVAGLKQRAGVILKPGVNPQLASSTVKINGKMAARVAPDDAKTFMATLGDDVAVIQKDPALRTQREYLDKYIAEAYNPEGFRAISKRAGMSEDQFQGLYHKFVNDLASKKVTTARSVRLGGKVKHSNARAPMADPAVPGAPAAPGIAPQATEAAEVAALVPDAKTGPMQKFFGWITGKSRRNPAPGTLDGTAMMNSPESPVSSLNKSELPNKPGLAGKLFNFGKGTVSMVAWTVAPGLVMNLFNGSQENQIPPGQPWPEEASLSTSDDVPWISAEEELENVRNPPPETVQALKQGLEAASAAVGLPLDDIMGVKGTGDQRKQLAVQLENTLGMCWTVAICTTSHLTVQDATSCLARECNDPELNN